MREPYCLDAIGVMKLVLVCLRDDVVLIIHNTTSSDHYPRRL